MKTLSMDRIPKKLHVFWIESDPQTVITRWLKFLVVAFLESAAVFVGLLDILEGAVIINSYIFT